MISFVINIRCMRSIRLIDCYVDKMLSLVVTLKLAINYVVFLITRDVFMMCD